MVRVRSLQTLLRPATLRLTSAFHCASYFPLLSTITTQKLFVSSFYRDRRPGKTVIDVLDKLD